MLYAIFFPYPVYNHGRGKAYGIAGTFILTSVASDHTVIRIRDLYFFFNITVRKSPKFAEFYACATGIAFVIIYRGIPWYLVSWYPQV